MFGNLFRKNNSVKVVYDPPEQHVRIILDSFRIINQTTNPETYFSRYRLIQNEACKLGNYNRIIYDGMNAHQIYKKFYSENSANELHKEFVNRLFVANKEDNLVYQIHQVGLYMNKEVRDWFVKILDGKKYYFCKVKFNDNSNKDYTYITRDNTIAAGDTVVIPTGNGFVPDSKIMQVIDTFEASLDELEFPIEYLRCVEKKLTSIKCPNCGASISDVSKGKAGMCHYCGTNFYFL